MEKVIDILTNVIPIEQKKEMEAKLAMQEQEKKENEDKTRQEKQIQDKFFSAEKRRIHKEFMQEKEKKKNKEKKILDKLDKAFKFGNDSRFKYFKLSID